ncbi:MAG: phosphatidylglycerophosphatase A [Gammaproteobacteria bacterium]
MQKPEAATVISNMTDKEKVTDIVLPTFGELIRRPVEFLALGFGSGLAKVGPGTMGTLVAIPLFLLLWQLQDLFIYQVIIVAGSGAGIYLCGETARRMGVHDHGSIVWDEIIGYLVTMLPIVAFGTGTWPLWAWVVSGFVLFRIFDIFKPFPINLLDKKVHGGLGIMLDDILAGINSALVLYAIQLYLDGRFDSALTQFQ